MGANFIERLQAFMENQGINDNQMTVAAGLSVGLLGKVKKSGKGMNSSNIEKILSSYPILSPEWLMTGQGAMLKGEGSATSTEQKQEDEQRKMIESLTLPAGMGAPYYDVDFLGGFAEIGNDQTLNPTTRVYIQGFERADLWCNVTGHSMEPKISHGDIIGLHRCTLNDVQYGETYAVVMDDIRTVKILRRSSDPAMLRFVPVNKEEYDEQEFPKARIMHIYEVIAAVKKFF